MKQHLFYTFLFIFLATAIITILGVINVVPIKENYLNILFTTLIVELVGAVVSLFKTTDFFNEKNIKNEQKTFQKEIHTKEVSISQKEKTKGIDNSFLSPSKSPIDYFKKLEVLKNRFHAKEEFMNNFLGSKVSWEGCVKSVSGGKKENEKITIALKTIPDSFQTFFLQVPYTLKSKAYSLVPNDLIYFTGTVTDSSISPFIDAENFELKSNNIKSADATMHR